MEHYVLKVQTLRDPQTKKSIPMYVGNASMYGRVMRANKNLSGANKTLGSPFYFHTIEEAEEAFQSPLIDSNQPLNLSKADIVRVYSENNRKKTEYVKTVFCNADDFDCNVIHLDGSMMARKAVIHSDNDVEFYGEFRPYNPSKHARNYYLVDDNEQIIGSFRMPHYHIMSVKIRDDMRHKGYGYLMLKSFMNYHPGENFSLNVYADNDAAIALYKKLGFHFVTGPYVYNLTMEC